MEMMYTEIAAAIKKYGVSAQPRDYLNFLCLGRRERPLQNINSSNAMYKFGRCMIYVHSKVSKQFYRYHIYTYRMVNEHEI